MGGVISSIFEWLFGGPRNQYPALGPNPDSPDPTTGLTPRQARAVLMTWDLVRPDLKGHGINFFVKLFQTYPDLQKYFRGMDKLSVPELRKSKRLAAHGTTVMTAISNIVDNLGDPGTLVEILKTTGVNHKKRGIKKESFLAVKKTLLVYFEENLGKAWTAEAKEGWIVALDAINAVVGSAYDQED